MIKRSLYKYIPGFDNKYLISKDGNIISIDLKKRQKIVKQQIHTKGYKKVHLFPINKSFFVHRLVYLTYKGLIDKGMQINHIDGNKINNHISNLELCTNKENINHAWKTGLSKRLYGHKNPNAKVTPLQVEKIRHLYSDKNMSIADLARKYHLSRAGIRKIVRRISWVDYA